MQMWNKTAIGLLLIACFGFTLQINDPFQILISKIQDYHSNDLQEKVYLHIPTDKFYSGELVRYSMHILDAQSHRKSELSKIGHIVLYNSKGKSIIHQAIETKIGIGQGDFFLPDTLSTGIYYLIGYTNWMRNSDSKFFKYETLEVINNRIPLISDKKQEKIVIQFFPEGGEIQKGVLNNIAFKVTDQFGNPLEFTGVLKNHENEFALNVSTFKYGLGKFQLNPTSDTYYVSSTENSLLKFALPEIKNEGVNLRSSSNSTEVNLDIEFIGKKYKELKYISLISHCRGHVNFAAKGPNSNQKSKVKIPKSKLNQGINHITIFDDNGFPLVERLFFITPNNRSEIDFLISSDTFNLKSPSSIELINPKEDTLRYSLSVSDRPKGKLNNIISTLYLTSDLSNDIPDPTYFLQNNDSSRIAADLLMLTHGWRRFYWDDVITEKVKTPVYIPESRGLIFQGKVINLDNKKTVTDSVFIISLKDKVPNFIVTTPSNKEEFSLAYYNIYGNRELYVSVLNGSSKNGYQLIDNNILPDISLPINNESYAFSNYLSDLKYKEKLVKRNYEIYINLDNTSAPTVQKISQNSFYQIINPDIIIDPDEFVQMSDLNELVSQLIPIANIRMHHGEPGIHLQKTRISEIRNIPEFYNRPALIFINGIPHFNNAKIFDMPTSNIDEISADITEYKYGELSASGVVSIITKDFDISTTKEQLPSNAIKYEGLALKREFYQPIYTNKQDISYHLPDLRHLLYWNGEGILGANETESFSFSTSDVEGDFFVTLEGITSSGTPVYIQKKFTVRKDLP